jgi:hypothetical protein
MVAPACVTDQICCPHSYLEEPDVTDDNRYFYSIALKDLRAIVARLGLDASTLDREALVDAILAEADEFRQLVTVDRSIPRVLEALYGGLARQDGCVYHGPARIAFNADGAYIEAELKRGQDRLPFLCIVAYLVAGADTHPTEADVTEWIAQQPLPVLGALTLGRRAGADGAITFLPVISVKIHPDGVMSDFIRELLSPFAQAWDTRSVATGTEYLEFGPSGEPYRVHEDFEIEPHNDELPVRHDSSIISTAQIPPISSATAKVTDSTQSSLEMYVVCLPIWDERDLPNGRQGQVVVLSAYSRDSPAVKALPIIDIPIYREIAERFLHNEACGTVAKSLGSYLMDAHTAMTVFGTTLPGNRPDLVAMLGNGYHFAPPPEATNLRPGRRKLNRG